MPLECSHSFRKFILWVGSKSTTLNDFWKPLWWTDTQAYTFTQQSLKFFRFLCRPMTKVPSTLREKKQLEPPTPTSSLQPDAILYQHLTFLTTRTHHCAPGPPASSALLHPTSESPAFGSQDSWDGGPFLRCNVASRVVKWPACSPGGGVEQYIHHGSSSLEFKYLAPNMIWKKSDLVLSEGHSKAKQILAEGHYQFLELSFCSQAARPETDQDLTDANLVQMQLLFLKCWGCKSLIHRIPYTLDALTPSASCIRHWNICRQGASFGFFSIFFSSNCSS